MRKKGERREREGEIERNAKTTMSNIKLFNGQSKAKSCFSTFK